MWRALIVVGLVFGSAVTSEAGVRIEINRFKYEAKPSAAPPTADAKTPKVDAAKEVEVAAQTTTIQTPTTVLTPAPENPVAETDATTIFPNLFEKSNKTMPTNSSNNRPIVSMATNTTTLLPVYPNALNPLLSEYTRRQVRRRLIPPNYYCPCDLKINFCDINCCCDIDCATKEIIQTLKCSEQEWTIHDYEETSDLQLCSQTHGFSLFCVVDNSRKRKEYRRRDYKVLYTEYKHTIPTVSTHSDLESQSHCSILFVQLHDVNILGVVQYRWPKRFDHSMHSMDVVDLYREHYIYGDPLLLWDEAEREIQHLSKFQMNPLQHILRHNKLLYHSK